MNQNHFTNKSTYKASDVIANVDSRSRQRRLCLDAYPPRADNADPFLAPLLEFRIVSPDEVHCRSDGRHAVGEQDPRPHACSVAGRCTAATWMSLVSVRSRGNSRTSMGPRAGPAPVFRADILFDKAKIPVISYAALFIKAEAAYRSATKPPHSQPTGIHRAHRLRETREMRRTAAPVAITAAEKAAFLADPNIVPVSPAALTLTQIMSQKYIAQWAWGHNEQWMDLRRYHYTDIDPAGGKQVFPGWAAPTNLYPDNSAKIVQRIRPRYNSEYVWNRPGLDAIGGLALDYHTKPLWITQP